MTSLATDVRARTDGRVIHRVKPHGDGPPAMTVAR